MGNEIPPPDGPAAGGSPVEPSDATPRAAESYYSETVWKRFYAFMLGPALVAAAIVAFVVGYNVLFREAVDPVQLIRQLKQGGTHSRAQAAFQLTTYLQPSLREGAEVGRDGPATDTAYGEKLAAVRVYVPELIAIFTAGADGAAQSDGDGDVEVKRFLALSFGYLADLRPVPALASALSAEDNELVHYALVSLAKTSELTVQGPNRGELDVAAIEAVVACSRRPEPDLRATAVYVLGVLGGPLAVARLEEAVTDLAPAVKWNAAFGLARHGNLAGQEVLGELLDRGPLWAAAGPEADRQRDLFLNAVRSAGMVRAPMLDKRLTRIAEGDEDLRARDLAMKIIATRAAAPTPTSEPSPGPN